LLDFLRLINEVFAIVLGAVADRLEGVEAGCRGGVGVDVDHLAALDVLEQSHCGVARIVLHHSFVVLAIAHIESRMLEDTSLSIGALRGVLQEVLAN